MELPNKSNEAGCSPTSVVPAESKVVVAVSPELSLATISPAPEFSPANISIVATPFASVDAVPESLPKVAKPSGWKV